jgi:hypothetical protein
MKKYTDRELDDANYALFAIIKTRRVNSGERRAILEKLLPDASPNTFRELRRRRRKIRYIERKAEEIKDLYGVSAA